MTVHAADPSRVRATTRPGPVLAAQLHVMRKRARRILAFRYWLVAAGPAIVAGQILSFITRGDDTQTLTILALSLAASFVAAVAAAVRCAPTLQGTAAIVDRRQRLESRVTTGLQFAEDDDPVAMLVTRDAAARLAVCKPADVFPIELPARWPWMVGGAAAASLIVALTLGEPATRQPSSGIGHGAAGGSAQVRSPNDSSRAASSAQTSVNPVEPAAKEAVVSREDQRPLDTSASSRGTAPAPRGVSDEKSPAPAPARGSSTPAAGGGARDGVSRGPMASTASSTDRAGAGAASKAAPDATGLASAGAGRAGAGPGSSSATGAGGVKGGTLTLPGPDAATTTPAPPVRPDSAQYRAAWERGQAAVARDRVPPALRKYVRDYFAAIRPRQP